MVTVSIKDEYVEVLSALGDLQAAMDLAIQRYTIEQITAKVAELRQRNAQYQVKYGMDYLAFNQRVSEDEVFINHLELHPACLLIHGGQIPGCCRPRQS
jgi:hypothetical protein